MARWMGSILVLGLAAVALADAPPVSFTVTGTDQTLTNVVVRVPVPAKAFDGVTDVGIEGKGTFYFGQVAPPSLLSDAGADQAEVSFLLPKLEAKSSQTFKILTRFPLDGTPKRFQWSAGKGTETDLLYGGRRALRFVHPTLDDSSKESREQTYKVFHHLFDPAGEGLLTKGAGGEYTHHRGIYFGFNKITYGKNQKADIWHCTGDTHQSHDGIVASAGGVVFGRHRLNVGWHGEKKELFASENRELTLYSSGLGGWLVEFASVVSSKSGKVRLDGDPQHAGFHFRAANEVADQAKQKKPQTYFLRPSGKGEIGKEQNWDPKTKKGPVNLPWNAMSFVIGGQRYTAVYLDHPANPKEARGSERVYGRIGSYFEYDVTPETPLKVRYRLWVQRGEMTVAQCDALSAAFVQTVKVQVP